MILITLTIVLPTKPIKLITILNKNLISLSLVIHSHIIYLV